MGNSISKYESIKQELRDKIERMEYKPNQVLPSESELCQQYQVSRVTVRKAVDDLVQDKLLYRIKGKGCFVRERSTGGLSRIHSFTEAIVHQGQTPGRKQLYFERETAGEAIARRLEIAPEDPVYRLKCLYLADERPYCINSSVLPAAMFPRLEAFNFNVCSLYEVLKSFYQLNISRVKQSIVATMGDEEIQQTLGLQQAKPLLQIRAESYCLHENHEKPFEVYESYILTEVLSYSVEKYNM